MGGHAEQYYYNYNALGKLTGVTNSGLYYGYTYADNGLLQQRDTPLWTQTVTARDVRGRVLNQNTSMWQSTVSTETIQWRNDERIDTYSTNQTYSSTASESRTYTYDKRGRVTNEPFILSGTQQSAQYFFDQTGGGDSRENGLGVRTLQFVNSSSGYQITAQSKFMQPTQDFDASASPSWTYNFGYDAAGNVITQSYVGDGSRTFTWDAWGRCVKIAAVNGNSGYNFSDVYDGLGRRVQSSFQNTSGGVPYGAISTLVYYYDPQVEFLQLGMNNGGARQWNVYGPDVSGAYGAQQGSGGLAATIVESSGSIVGQLSNFFGDVVGQTWVDSGGYGHWGWWGAALGSYGAMPGSSVTGLAPQWRGFYEDWTGYICMGSRLYFPSAGRFLSPDPLGHGASMSLYAYCEGDGVNRLDPTGRCLTRQIYNPDYANSILPDSSNYLTQSTGNTAWKNAYPSIFDRAQQTDYAQLANAVYQNDGGVSNGSIPFGYHVVAGDELNSLGLANARMSDSKSGFYSALYQNDYTGSYVLAYRGTESGNDWANNVAQGTGFNSTQYNEAIQLGRAVYSALGNDNVTYVGHSLGGGLATAASLATNTPAVTFNAAAVNNYTLSNNGISNAQNANQHITAFYIRGEILSDVQHVSADGVGTWIRWRSYGIVNPVGIAQGNRIGLDPVSSWYHAIDKHSMAEILGSMKP